MTTLAFDTLRYARRLKEAGVPESQAEVQAELMAEAFGFYSDNLLTKDHFTEVLSARFAEQEARFEAKLEAGLDSVESRIEKRFREHDSKLERGLGVLDMKMDQRFNKQDANHRVLTWMLSMVIVTVVLPQLMAWLA